MNSSTADGLRLLETGVAAFLGAIAFHWLGLPAPSLSGAMVGVALMLAVGRQPLMPRLLANAAMLMSGVAMGAAVTPEMLAGFQKYPLSIAIFLVTIAVTIAVNQAFLRRFGGWDRLTAFLAAAPGALSSVLAVAAETKADILKVTTLQSFRLFMLVAVLPTLVMATGGVGVLQMRPDATPLTLLALCAAGFAVALVMDKFGLAAPWIFGGLVGSALLHGSGAVVGDAPQWFMESAFALVGVYIGTRFSTITREALFGALAMSAGSLVIGLMVAFAAAYLLHSISGLPLGMVLVAFAPGGLEAMLVLGASLGMDPIYVGLHHLIRFFGIALLLPAALPIIRRLEAADVPLRDKS